MKLFLRGWLLLADLGARKIPKLKGLFYYFYKNLKNKSGMIKVKTIDGNQLYIDLADKIISAKLLQYGFWEEGLTSLTKKLIKPGMVVLDIGAHVGYYSVLFSKLVGPKGKIFSFEPDPHNNLLLKSNIKLNNISNCVVEQLAASNEDGTLNLHLNSENLGAHSLALLGESKGSVAVKTISLDSYLRSRGEKRVDFMKIDIECWEDMALQGAKEILENNRNTLIVLEFYPSALKKLNKDPKAFLQTIRAKGFNIYTIHNNTGALSKKADDQAIIDFCGKNLTNLLISRNNL